MTLPLPSPSPGIASLYVALGGALGAVARYQLGRAAGWVAGPGAGLPWGTLIANVAGSLAMGVLMGWLARSGGNEAIRLALGVGVLGGFTTFSAFSMETIQLLGRGQVGTAAAYVAVSVLAGLAALYAGLFMMRGSG
ncbi:MAG: fluoride efflux transporter CrcB [Erythrobacter sp.]|uniref:fluoride efflux transporter CrcB n=1 Tax=Erythrobacter sp. TaxID=1042 RepID=UPI003C7749B5